MSVAVMSSCWGPDFPAGPHARLVALALADSVDPDRPEIVKNQRLLDHLESKTGFESSKLRTLLGSLVTHGVLTDLGSTLRWEWGR